MSEVVKTPIRFGPFELSPDTGELRRDGIRLKISGQALDVLLLLTSNPGHLVSRDDLRQKLWAGAACGDFEHGLNAAVNRLREVLGDSATTPKYIETVPRRGYRFIEAVVSPAEPGNEVISQPSAAPRSPNRIVWVFAGIAILILAALAVRFARREFGAPSSDSQSPHLARITEEGNVADIGLSPDGRFLAFVVRDADRSSLLLRQVGTEGQIVLVPPEAAYLFGVAFSPDGNFIYYARAVAADNGAARLYRVHALGGVPRLVLNDVDSAPSFSPDGRRFAFTRGTVENTLELRVAEIDATGDTRLASWGPAEISFNAGPSWSPDGKTIVVPVQLAGTASRFVLKAYDVTAGKERDIFSSVHAIGRTRWTPDGQNLILTLEDSDHRGQLWMIPSRGGEARRLTNDLADYSLEIGSDASSNLVAAIQKTVNAQIWEVNAPVASPARQLTLKHRAFIRLDPGPDGRILATTNNRELFTIKLDGEEPVRFTDLTSIQEAIWCGPYVVAAVVRDGVSDLVRIDAEGTNALKLASGALISPQCSLDGKYVYAADIGAVNRILRIPVAGGQASEVIKIAGENFFGHLLLSRDGETLVYRSATIEPHSILHLVALNLATGKAENREFHGAWGGPIRWSPDGSALQYRITTGGVSNLWEEPLAGNRPARQVTHFTSDYIFDFAWTRDGKQIVLSRGTMGGDAVLLSNFRP